MHDKTGNKNRMPNKEDRARNGGSVRLNKGQKQKELEIIDHLATIPNVLGPFFQNKFD